MTDATDKSLGIALARVSTLEEKKMVDDHAGSEHEENIPNAENVTQHELNTLRHVGDTLPMTAWLVVFVEFAERLVVIQHVSCSSDIIISQMVILWHYKCLQ